jgi:exodeoxyribonuclease VII small subunit
MSAKPAKINLPADIAALSFEEALAQLEGIVRTLESGQGKLDDAIAAYERGAFLRAHCEAKLSEAQARIEKITPQPDGRITTTELESS